MKKVYILLLSFFIFLQAHAQFSQAARDSINKLTQADFVQMLEQLKLDPNQQRRGPSGNPQDPNAANSAEELVRNYVLPDPLLLKEGGKVKSKADWWEQKRPETVEEFEREIYGRLPDNVPGVSWKVKAAYDTVIGNFPIREKILIGAVDNSAYPDISVEIELLVATPLHATSAVPLVMEFGFIRSPFGPGPGAPAGMGANEPSWKEQLISKGWGYAVIVPSSFQADNGAGLTQGIIGLVNQGNPRTPEQWGTLRAWAWGASRAMDYFETDKEVDETKVAIEGLSRYGKAAVVAMAFEPRFSLGFIGSSGAGGTKILRRNFGEQIENLASSGEYHWFCGNFIKYAGPLNQDDLPVDAHQLVALCAPRPVFISVGSPFVEGNWIDARGMFIAGLHAGPVYELLGKKGLETREFPVLGQALTQHDIAFRQHAGGHTTGPNWSTWIAWASKYWD
ncbi:glucuronyl esterase domain-containing protein [Pararhodonellum marinum]|uniref:glucuronyl esterase domain-containing protein n=1 Tax=Pararhodonellum marinum TaxID=2755358 RepID=UPI00188EA667|nr:acetylxylan esterase [Pararhodonellum marinum]